MSILGPAISELRDRSGADIGSIGILFVGQSLGYLVTSLAGGRLYDRVVAHRLFAGAFAMIALGLASVPSFTTLPPLFVVFVVVGIGAAMVDVGGNTLLLWELGSSGDRAMNVLHLCFGLGALSAPLFVYVGLDVAVRGAALGCVALAVWALSVPSPTVRIATEEQQTSPSRPLLALLAAFFLLYVGLEVGFGSWVHTYAEEIEFSALGATWLTATFWIGFTIGRLLSSALAPKLRPKIVLAGSCVASVVAVGILVVGSGRTAPVWIGTAMIGVATAPQFPVMLTYLERRIQVTGSATSWFIGGAGIGGLTFPWLIGRWFDAAGPWALPWACLLLALATLASFVAIDRVLGG